MKSIFFQVVNKGLKFYWKIFRPHTFGVRVIICYQDKILLVKNINYSKWVLPGGGFGINEKPINALKRELFEETGIIFKKQKFILLGKYFNNYEGKRDKILIYYTFTKKRFEIKPCDLEIKKAKYFKFNNLPKNISPGTARRIKEFLPLLKASGEKILIKKW